MKGIAFGAGSPQLEDHFSSSSAALSGAVILAKSVEREEGVILAGAPKFARDQALSLNLVPCIRC